VPASFDDFVPAPNIGRNPEVYETENEALERHGGLQRALWKAVPWTDARVVDLGCGTGFWLERYLPDAAQVVGVEPDPTLLARARARREQSTSGVQDRCRLVAGSAEHPGLPLGSADLVHARWAYFFGAGAERGLAAVRRLLAPGGAFVAVDNAWTTGPPRRPGEDPPGPLDFTWLLRHATGGNASHDPAAIAGWWAAQGAVRHDVEGGWAARDRDELERILRIEFPSQTVDRFLELHTGHTLRYRMALYVVRGAS
jgi:SAM-dependent methyltransferase